LLNGGYNVVSIHGVPRSGTSWLGQIFNSHQDVAYRHQPLFSHRFKNRVDQHSSPEDWATFVRELYDCVDDDFINDAWSEQRKPPFEVEKRHPSKCLVMKMVRYHQLIPKFLEWDNNLKVIGIIRNPCAVINSWLGAPLEFDKSWSPADQWRFAPAKNLGRPEEFNGFEKWKEVARLFLDLEQKCSRFMLVRFEELVTSAEPTTQKLFGFCGLSMEEQVQRFLSETQSRHSDNPYGLTKSPEVRTRWKTELNPKIRDAIHADLAGSELEQFVQ
jgi:hypothetical protein